MSIELFEKNAYVILGVDYDTPSGDLMKAFAEAKRTKRAKDAEINVARQELGKPELRLVLDALTLTPRVPDTVLDHVSMSASGELTTRPIDVINAILIVPEVTVSFADAKAPQLERRHALADNNQTPEIEL